jgi:hypothetical protein
MKTGLPAVKHGLTILRDLTESTRSAGAMGSGRGRYARTPNFAAPSAPSTRPTSDRGSTFHFAHKTISKARDISDGNHSQTTSSAHQGYIERPSAAELSDPAIDAAVRDRRDDVFPDIKLHPSFTYPDRISDPERVSFGTLGSTKADRKRFWRDVEDSEPARSRVQSRIIAELPVELEGLDRALVAKDFCKSFEERALPYWAVIHSPGKKNDKRNYHLHVTYLDRPAGRDDSGRWDFSVQEKKRMRVSGNHRMTRPFKMKKHDDTRKIGWPKKLRQAYADACNFYLSLAGLEKRLDPRSYKESGIDKEPTEHLGTKASAMESIGLETSPGTRNAQREIRWKITKAEAPWRTRAESLNADPVMSYEENMPVRDALFQIASQGITTARRSASYSITSGLLETRIDRRKDFLEGEVKRLSGKDDISDLSSTNLNIIALDSEGALIDDRYEEIKLLATKCRDESSRLSKSSSDMVQEFDRLRRLSDPDTLFNEDPLYGAVPIDEIAVDNTYGKRQSTDLQDQDSTIDLTRIAELLAGTDRTSKAETEQVQSSHAEAEDSDGRRKITSIEAIIAQISSPDFDAENVSGRTQFTAADFPGAMPLDRTSEPRALKDLDETLRALDNRSLRQAAIATRDATDICPNGPLREQFNRGWVVLRHEAGQRGVDLDTGQHRPEAALDAERATLHTDQDVCTIRVLRKNIARQRVRG